jgi:Na+/melibiose symporter-like transporter
MAEADGVVGSLSIKTSDVAVGGGATSLNRVQRFCLAFSYFGQIYGIALFLLHAVFIFNIYYGASASALGAAGIFMGFYNALNGMPIARYADAGHINRYRCCRKEKCGRRGPWMAIGIPQLAIACFCLFVSPTTDPTGLVLWFLFVYFLVSNGFTAGFQSTLGVLQETMFTDKERARQTMLAVPFNMVAYILAGLVVPAALFTQVPDSVTSCCVQPLSKCAKVPCACVLAGENSTVRFDTGFGRKCTEMIATAALRETACGEAATYQPTSFLVTGVVSFVLIMTALAGLIPAPLGTVKNKSEPMFLIPSIVSAFKSSAFRWLAWTNFWNALSQQLMTGFTSYFFLYSLGVDFIDIGGEIATVVAVGISFSMAVVPAWNYILGLRQPENKSMPKYHPATVGIFCAFFDFLVCTICYTVSMTTSSTLAFTVGACVSGVFNGSGDQIFHSTIGWVMDEDERVTGLRREGMFYACNGAVQHLSVVVYFIMVAILGAVGFDGKTCPQDQPPSVSSLVFTYIILSRAFKLVSGLGYYMFPIREKVLEDLLEFKAAQVPK